MDAVTLQNIFETIWTRETSAFPEIWTPENPALGQCLSTSWIAYEELGGKVEMLSFFGVGRRLIHFRNVLPNGQMMDFTSTQLDSFDIDLALARTSDLTSADFKMWRKYFPMIDSRYKVLYQRFKKASQGKDYLHQSN